MADNKADRIHHIAIAVDDIAATIDWYRKNFNCQIAYQDKTWAMLEFANIKLALVTPGMHQPHIGIVRLDADKFGPLTVHRDGTKSVYIKDNAGNSVEILAKD